MMTLTAVVKDLRDRAKAFRADQHRELGLLQYEPARLSEHKARLLEQVADDYEFIAQGRQRRAS